MTLHTIMLPERTLEKFRQYKNMTDDNSAFSQLSRKYGILDAHEDPTYVAIQKQIKDCVSSITNDVYLACKEAGYLD